MKSVLTTAVLATAALAQADVSKTYRVSTTNAKFGTAIAENGGCFEELIMEQVASHTVFIPKAATLSEKCNTALTDNGTFLPTVSNTSCFKKNDDDDQIKFTYGGEFCPLDQGWPCQTGQVCSVVEGDRPGQCVLNQGVTNGFCKKDPIDLSKTLIVPTNNQFWINATSQGGKCENRVASGTALDKTVFVFKTKVPNIDCVKALTSNSAAVYTEKSNSKCFTEGTDAAKTITYTPGTGSGCPLDQAATCKKGQYCAPIDGKAQPGLCPTQGTTNEGVCPIDSEEIEPITSVYAIQTKFTCGGTCTPAPFKRDAEFDKCWDKVVSGEKATEFKTACTDKASSTQHIVPSDKTRTTMIITQAYKTKDEADACHTVINKFETDMKTCLTGEKTTAAAVYNVIELSGECLDQKNQQILCKTVKGCDLACADGIDCTTDTKICGGECVDVEENKKECTSAATQLVAGVVAVAALVIAFF